MAQSNRQRIRSIDLWFGGELEQVHDHHHHLLFIRSARPRYSLLDLCCRIFGNLQAFFGTRDN